MTSWKHEMSLAFILACVVAAPGFGQSEPSDPCPPAKQCWTTQDVIDGHIDHHAQSVMMGMMERGGEEAVDASSMLCAVKRGELEGIYLPNQQVPALRARGVGSNWWEMIPQGKHSACYKLPAERPPMIVFREQVQDLRPELAAALREAWLECGSVSVARCYVATIQRPPSPQPAQPGEDESEMVGLKVNVFQHREGAAFPAAGAFVTAYSVGGDSYVSGTAESDGRLYFSPLTPDNYEVIVRVTPDRQGCPATHSYEVALTTPDTEYTLNSHFFCLPIE